jgi:RNA polymerase sigma-70 factor (ECF subfamily)
MVALTEAMQTDLASPEFDAGLALEQQEAECSLLECLQRLPANQQRVIRLKFQERLSYQQIAEATGLSVSNVGFLIHRGLKTLRQMMGKDK